MVAEYFTGVAGHAALGRASRELIVDVNGDRQYGAAITLPGGYQLEDFNLIS